MAFDYQSFFNAEGITYSNSGKNVRKDHIALQCPFCGDADTGQHMGVNLKTGVWGCWRNKSHSGGRPEPLIAALKGINFGQAKRLIGDGYDPAPESLPALMGRLKALDRPFHFQERIKLPGEFRPLSARTQLTQRFWRYLYRSGKEGGRGFPREDCKAIARKYQFHYSLTGRYAGRIILPSYRGVTLVGWTGRAINPNAELRYDSFPTGEDGLKRAVYNHNAMFDGGRYLVVVEGPLDAIPVDYYGHPYNIRSIGCLSTSLTASQLADVLRYGKRFERVLILLDAKATAQALSLASALAPLRPRVGLLPFGVKDPGSIRPDAIPLTVRRAWKGEGVIDI